MSKFINIESQTNRVQGLRAELSQKKTKLGGLTAAIGRRTAEAAQLRNRIASEKAGRKDASAEHMALVASVLGGAPDGKKESGATGMARMVESMKADAEGGAA